MKIKLHTPQGIIEKELTQEELEQYAADGNVIAKHEIAKQEMITADTDNKKIDVILKFLDLK